MLSKVTSKSREVKLSTDRGATSKAVAPGALEDVDVRVALIQSLIPLGLDAVEEILQNEVAALTGQRYSRKAGKTPNRRWGAQSGSVYLSDQKVPITVPRVRDMEANEEVPLQVYRRLQRVRHMDEGLLLRVVSGSATRSYESCAEAVPEAFGLSSSTVSRRFIKASAAKLRQFQERSLSGYDLVGLFMDGKTFADQEMIIALGVTIDGHKVPLGFVQAASENERVCRQFVDALIDRGLQYHQGLLCLIDGSKGLRAALTKALSGYVAIQRCQWHKRENVIAYLPKSQHHEVRKALHDAYDKETYEKRRQSRAAGPQTLPGADEYIGTEQPRGRARRNPHTPSAGTHVAAQTVVPHHQLYRIPQRHGRTAHSQRKAMEQPRSAISVVGSRAVGYRTPIAEDQRIPISSHTQTYPTQTSPTRS